MPSKAARQDDASVSPARKDPAQKVGGLGLFGTAGISNGGRNRPPVEPTVSDAGAGDGDFRRELNRLLRLPASELNNIDHETMTAGQVLARIILKKAVLDETQSAIEIILDRIEGKPTKAAANKPNNDALTDQLNTSIDDLNDLLPEKE